MIIFFASLFNAGRGLAFPCSDDGIVNLDAMSERARSNYFNAMALVGKEYATPCLRPDVSSAR